MNSHDFTKGETSQQLVECLFPHLKDQTITMMMMTMMMTMTSGESKMMTVMMALKMKAILDER